MRNSARNLNSNAGGKRCTLGKSCGATCIDAQERCVLELGPEIQKVLPKVRKLIQTARGVAENYGSLDTAEKAVNWLDSHVKDMAGWGLTESQIDNLVETRPKFITMGVEPAASGVGPNDLIKGIQKPGTLGDGTIRDKGKGDYGDLLYKANQYKLNHEVTQALYNLDPEKYPKTPTDLSRILTAYGANTKEVLKNLKHKGMITEDGKLRLEGNFPANRLSSEKNIDWGAINRAMANEVAPGERWGRANPSGLWKPSQDYEQFAALYDKIGRNPGPFKNNASWYKYVDQRQGEMLERVVREAKPQVMYVGASGNKDAEARFKKMARESGTFTVQARKKDGSGDITPKTFRYYLIPHGDETQSVAIFGGHPGGRAFSMSENLAKAVGQIGKSLHDGGLLPASLNNAKLVDQTRMAAEAPKPMRVPAGKIAKQAQKEMAAPAKVAQPKADAGAARQKLNGYVQTLRNQGQKDAQIRQALQKLGIPAELISEMV